MTIEDCNVYEAASDNSKVIQILKPKFLVLCLSFVSGWVKLSNGGWVREAEIRPILLIDIV